MKASLGIKIVAPDLEKAIAGSRLLVLGEDDDEDELREDIMSDLTNLMESVDKSGLGVSVQASTLGSLEALLEFLKTSKIPVSSLCSLARQSVKSKPILKRFCLGFEYQYWTSAQK